MAIALQQPVFGGPAVHDCATVHFVNGFSTETGVSVIKQIEYVESLCGRQGHR